MGPAIIKALLDLGIPAHLEGYEFLKTALQLCLEDRTYINKVQKRLYPEIARITGFPLASVDRAMRHAIEVAWDCGGMKKSHLAEIWAWKPTNSEFIATVAERLRMEQAAV